MSSDDLLNADEVFEIVTNSRRSTTRGGGGGALELDYKVLDFEIKRFGDDVLGFLGEYFNLIVRIEQNVSAGNWVKVTEFIIISIFSRRRSIGCRISSSQCHGPTRRPGE